MIPGFFEIDDSIQNLKIQSDTDLKHNWWYIISSKEGEISFVLELIGFKIIACIKTRWIWIGPSEFPRFFSAGTWTNSADFSARRSYESFERYSAKIQWWIYCCFCYYVEWLSSFLHDLNQLRSHMNRMHIPSSRGEENI